MYSPADKLVSLATTILVTLVSTKILCIDIVFMKTVEPCTSYRESSCESPAKSMNLGWSFVVEVAAAVTLGSCISICF